MQIDTENTSLMETGNTGTDVVRSGQVQPVYEFVSFWLDEELFGLNILDVKEMTPVTEITPVFHAPKKYKGYVNIRGEIHLVLDLRVMMGLETKKVVRHSKIAILKPHVAELFGILVDRVGDVLEVNQDQMEVAAQTESNSSASQVNTELITGICKLENRLLTVLNARKLYEA